MRHLGFIASQNAGRTSRGSAIGEAGRQVRLPVSRRCRPGALVATTALAAALAMLPAAAPPPAQAQTPPVDRPTMQARHQAASIALERGNIAEARALIASGIDPKLRDAAGHTLLHDAAVYAGDATLVAELLRAGAAVDARSDLGETPLLAAVAHAHYVGTAGGPERLLAVVDRLLAAAAATDVRDGMGTTLFERALARRHAPLLERLIQRRMPVPDSALLLALKAADDAAGIDITRLLLEQALPRHLAARDEEGRTPAHAAARRKELLPLLQRLAARGADLKATDGRGLSVFAEAAFAANLPAMRWLAERGALTHAVDADGQTPLHLAAWEPRQEVLQWLLKRGASATARDKRGRNALDIAIDTHRFAWRTPEDKLAMARLLGGGADDVARGRFAQHPLHRAIAARDLGAVEALLRQGADPNVRDDSGYAPLHAALSYSSTLPNTPAERAFGRKLLPLLLRHGADPLRMHEAGIGSTYVDVARQLRVLDLLEREMRANAPRR